MMRARMGIGARVGIIAVVLFLAALLFVLRSEGFGATGATGVWYTQDGFNLKIDSTAIYNGASVAASTWTLKNLVPHTDKFFNISDVKPGDDGQVVLSFHVNKDAWVCMDFKNLQEKENGKNEPESLVDSSSEGHGELDEGTEFFAWYDDGDKNFEVGEVPLFGTTTQSAATLLKDKTYALADKKHGQVFVASTTRYVGISWCAGDLTVNLATAAISCNGEVLGNEAQTDSFSVDLSLRAVEAKGQPKFQCTPTVPTSCKKAKGNNGHGNDTDGNDNSNPGNSNDPSDYTDDDGLPPGFAKKLVKDAFTNYTWGKDEDCVGDEGKDKEKFPFATSTLTSSTVWQVAGKQSVLDKALKSVKQILKKTGS